MGRLDKKIAIITGAASGIGHGIAKAFTSEGAAVVIADINEAAGAEAARECSSGAGRAVFHRVDVTSEQDFKDVIATTVKEFGRLNILVNNAGGGPWSTFERTTLENWDKTFALTLRSAFLGMKLAIPEMRKAGGGSIISIASNAGIRAMPPLHAYSAAKAGVINLTASVARLVGKDFIRVNCISPGLIATPGFFARRGRPAALCPTRKRRLPRPSPSPKPARRRISRRWRCFWPATSRSGFRGPRWSSTEARTPPKRCP
jgi:cyclopentanol dehydrogenase